MTAPEEDVSRIKFCNVWEPVQHLSSLSGADTSSNSDRSARDGLHGDNITASPTFSIQPFSLSLYRYRGGPGKFRDQCPTLKHCIYRCHLYEMAYLLGQNKAVC